MQLEKKFEATFTKDNCFNFRMLPSKSRLSRFIIEIIADKDKCFLPNFTSKIEKFGGPTELKWRIVETITTQSSIDDNLNCLFVWVSCQNIERPLPGDVINRGKIYRKTIKIPNYYRWILLIEPDHGYCFKIVFKWCPQTLNYLILSSSVSSAQRETFFTEIGVKFRQSTRISWIRITNNWALSDLCCG